MTAGTAGNLFGLIIVVVVFVGCGCSDCRKEYK
jgi:hypothetical protein